MKKTLITAGILSSLLLGGSYLYNLSSLSKNIVVEQKIASEVVARLFTIPTKLKLSITVTIKNSSKTEALIKMPFVNIFLLKDDKAPFASSVASSKDFTIPAFGQVNLDPIVLVLDLTTAAMRAPAIISNAKKTGVIGIYFNTITYIDNRIRVEQPDFKELKLT